MYLVAANSAFFLNNAADFSASTSANVSIFFDLGGIVGGITAGVLNDKFGKPANTCFWMLVTSVPMVGCGCCVVGGADIGCSVV